MPTTTSPWASPSSPAGRRLLLTEPATLDAVPVLDDAALAALARVAGPTPSSSPASPTETPSPLGAARRTAIRWRFDARRRPGSAPRWAVGPAPTPSRRAVDRRAARRLALGAAAAVALLALAAPAVPGSEPGAATRSSGVAVAPLGLGRVVGQAVATTPPPVSDGGAATRPPAAAGDVVVALVQPTESLRATPPVRAPASTLGARLGAAVVLAAG